MLSAGTVDLSTYLSGRSSAGGLQRELGVGRLRRSTIRSEEGLTSWRRSISDSRFQKRKTRGTVSLTAFWPALLCTSRPASEMVTYRRHCGSTTSCSAPQRAACARTRALEKSVSDRDETAGDSED
eukprot:11689511-Heterocapsa_arctica.AAC.1